MREARERLDRLLVERGMAPTRERAQRLILSGAVRVRGRVVDKPGTQVERSAELSLARAVLPYVSRGGVKLEAALRYFGVDVRGRIAMDVGASTGGFTDCLLQHGAARVYAVDVGYGQLAWALRRDARVVVLERTNIRSLRLEQLPERPELVTVDVSFISLRLVLPKVAELVAPGAEVLALVKPQFEVGRGRVGKGGVVRDRALQAEAVAAVVACAEQSGMRVRGTMESPLLGPKGNREFFVYAVDAR